MKKLLSKIFVALAIIGMVTFIAPKKAMAEQSQPDCWQVQITCADGSQHGVALVCDLETLAELLAMYCNVQVIIDR